MLPPADRVARRLGPPTEFELLTAMMFRHFAEVGLDVALVEVGLGGRLDATNAWDGGVAVLTNVGLDHTDRLGPTIGAIAREKVAIVKRGDLAVTGAEARRSRSCAADAPGSTCRWRSRRRRRSWAGRATRSTVELPGLGATESGCAVGTRRPMPRSPTPSSTPSRLPGSPRSRPTHGAAATRPPAGRAAWSS